MSETMSSEEAEQHNKSRRNALVLVRPDTPHPWMMLRVRPATIDSDAISELSSPEEEPFVAPNKREEELKKKEAAKNSPKKKNSSSGQAGPSASLPTIKDESPAEKPSGCCIFYNFP